MTPYLPISVHCPVFMTYIAPLFAGFGAWQTVSVRMVDEEEEAALREEEEMREREEARRLRASQVQGSSSSKVSTGRQIAPCVPLLVMCMSHTALTCLHRTSAYDLPSRILDPSHSLVPESLLSPSLTLFNL